MVVVGRVGGDEGSQDAMTGNRQRLRKKICHVVKSADEQDTEVSLAYSVPDPVQAHVRGLGHALRNGVGCDADGFFVPLSRCGPMLAKIFCSFVAMRAAAYKPAYSASATKEQTTGIMWVE